MVSTFLIPVRKDAACIGLHPLIQELATRRMALVGARPVALPNGTYRMYYQGHAGSKDRLLSAISTDGLTWTREAGVRLESAIYSMSR